jgi:predicted HicB family RNase H-like nuclease
MKKQKTTTRTLRFSEDLNKILDRDSKDKGVSTNSLISSILTKYAEWDRYTEKLALSPYHVMVLN